MAKYQSARAGYMEVGPLEHAFPDAEGSCTQVGYVVACARRSDDASHELLIAFRDGVTEGRQLLQLLPKTALRFCFRHLEGCVWGILGARLLLFAGGYQCYF